jgi:hypothetical protein
MIASPFAGRDNHYRDNDYLSDKKCLVQYFFIAIYIIAITDRGASDREV